MACTPGWHETPLSTLLGSVTTPSTTELLCAPDSDGCSGIFDCSIQALSDVKGGQVALATAQSIGTLAEFYATSGLSTVNLILEGVAVAEHNPALLQASEAFSLATDVATVDWTKFADLGETTMGLFDDLSFEGIADWTSQLVSEVDWQGVGSFGLEAAQAFLPATTQPQAIPVMAPVRQAATAAAGAIARVGPTVGRKFFDKFPNLAVAIQKMRNAGHNISRSKLYSMMRRFGPEFMVSAGLLTAAAVSELIMAGPGHRKMNVGNVKALRRGMRRIESFHKLCGKADRLRRPKARVVSVKSCR